MKVFKFRDKASWWWVESQSLECLGCFKLFARTETRYSALVAGDRCPKACGGTLAVQFHECGVAALWPVGSCSCRGFTMAKRPKLGGKTPLQYLRNMTQEQRRGLSHQRRYELRCVHLWAAFEAAMELTTFGHINETANDDKEQGP